MPASGEADAYGGPLGGRRQMIWNLIDHRKRQYRWKEITAIIEPTCHDNRCKDSDQAPPMELIGLGYDERENISLAGAIEWAQGLHYPVTLYLYDLEDGIRAVTVDGEPIPAA